LPGFGSIGCELRGVSRTTESIIHGPGTGRNDPYTLALVRRTMAVFVAIPFAVCAAIAVLAVLAVSAIFMIITALVIAVTMMFLVVRNVFVLIPVVAHKVDPFVAGVVFTAMPAPVSGMARWDAQVDRLTIHRYPLDDPRLTIENAWRRIATTNVDLPIKTGLADADRYADIGRVRRNGGDGEGCCKK
jgi:hypothetical protein